MVLENLPLEDCHIAIAWKSRGSLSGVITIDLYPHAQPDIRKQVGLSHSNSSQGTGKNNETKRTERDYLASFGNNNQHERESSSCALKPYYVGPVCLSFDDMKRQFLLPFKHGSKEEVGVLSTYGMKHDEPVAFVNIPALSEATAGSVLHILGRRATQRRVKCMEERVIPPEVKYDVILQMQKSLYGLLLLTALGIRDEHEKLSLYEALVADTKVTQLIQSLARYPYLQVFVKLGCTGAADLIKQHASEARSVPTTALEEIDALYVAIVRISTAVKQKLTRGEEKGISLFLPLPLLELRVCVEAVYRIQCSVSFNVTGPTMQYILMQMDGTITKLLGPTSTSAALSSSR